MAMTLVETVTVGSGGVSTISFSSIPQTGKDLLLMTGGRTSSLRVNGDASLRFRLNGETSDTNYSGRILRGDGSAASSSTAAPNYVLATSNAATANTFANTFVYFPNYTSSAVKSYSQDAVMENNATASRQEIIAGAWNNTDAITEIVLDGIGSTILEHSTVSLYIIS